MRCDSHAVLLLMGAGTLAGKLAPALMHERWAMAASIRVRCRILLIDKARRVLRRGCERGQRHASSDAPLH